MSAAYAYLHDRSDTITNAAIAVFVVLLIGGGVVGVGYEERQRDVQEADERSAVAHALKDKYGAEVIDSPETPWRPGAVKNDVAVQLPSGPDVCDIIVGEKSADVRIRCGSPRTEPPLTSTAR